jgi:diketogulonate reductase-like aldo/keto reductase
MLIVDLLTYATIKPSVNQIEVHPYNTQSNLIDYCTYNKIAVTAYSPLGRPGAVDVQPKLVDEPVITKIATQHKKTSAQVLLNWAIARGTITIPKSTTPKNISENGNIFDFELSPKEQEEISALNKNYRFVNPIEWWGIPYFE